MQVRSRSWPVVAITLLATATACGHRSGVHAAKVSSPASTESSSDAPTPTTNTPTSVSPSASASATSASAPVADALPQGPSQARIHYRNSPPTNPAKRAVYVAYAEYADMVVRAYLHPDPDDSAIGLHAGGQVRARIISTLRQFTESGTSTVGPAFLKPTVTSVVGSIALLTDCTDGRNERNYQHGRPTGERGTMNSTVYRLVKGSHGWTVTEASSGPAEYCR